MVALLKMPSRRTAEAEKAAAERRIFPRKEVHALVQGRRMDHTVSACQVPQMTLTLRDLSLGGLSAVSPTPLDRGERLTVYFPAQGPLRGWDAYGRVIRCDPNATGIGYRVAVEFDALPAA